MTRTKWMRLLVRDLSDVVRWASRQNARHIDSFRYRVVNGRESVSFRLIPRYAIQVGSPEIIVICHVRVGRLKRLASRAARAGHGLARCLQAIASRALPADQVPAALCHESPIGPESSRSAELLVLPWVRPTSSSSAS
ncbi:MAG: hypothetical protein JO038_08140 [Alphaproteobacteria bacterium]|nr:hypothetical protein [Alphaproteobacteria bacterium]